MKVVNGIMEMREVSTGLPVPAGGSVVLKFLFRPKRR